MVMVMVAACCRRGGGMAATSSSLRESRTTRTWCVDWKFGNYGVQCYAM